MPVVGDGGQNGRPRPSQERRGDPNRLGLTPSVLFIHDLLIPYGSSQEIRGLREFTPEKQIQVKTAVTNLLSKLTTAVEQSYDSRQPERNVLQDRLAAEMEEQLARRARGEEMTRPSTFTRTSEDLKELRLLESLSLLTAFYVDGIDAKIIAKQKNKNEGAITTSMQRVLTKTIRVILSRKNDFEEDPDVLFLRETILQVVRDSKDLPTVNHFLDDMRSNFGNATEKATKRRRAQQGISLAQVASLDLDPLDE
jgi:hypothetical protein